MPTIYDPEILQQYADDLYRQAKWIVFKVAFVSGFVAFIAGAFISAGVKAANDSSALLVGLGTLVAVLIGVAVGRAKAFELRLKAQMTLCQRQVEFNTRQAAVDVSRQQQPPKANSARENNCNIWLKMLDTRITAAVLPMVHVFSTQTVAEFYRRRSNTNLDKSGRSSKKNSSKSRYSSWTTCKPSRML